MKYFLCLALITVLSCQTNKAIRTERKLWNYKNWEQQFKDRAFCLCVLQSFSKPVQDSLFKQDKSFYDPMAMGVFDDAINQLLVEEKQKIASDSLQSLSNIVPGDIAHLINGKRVIPHCITLYKSKRLRRLAKQQKKYWRNITNVTEEIWKKVPSF